MGRAEREDRASRARHAVRRAIPEILQSSLKARHGLTKSELVPSPQAVVRTHITPATPVYRPDLKIRLSNLDCLTVAATLSERHYANADSRKASDEQPNVAVHNMGAATVRGGGFLNGANGQEEFLCHRSTLYASLFEEYYALPLTGGIFSPDVLVFRDPHAIDLPRRHRYFIDVITASVHKHPDQRGRYDERDASCSCGLSYCDEHKKIIVEKMKSVLRIAQLKGVKKLILGAWGAGVMNHPIEEVAKQWRKVIAGAQRQRKPSAEQWEGIDEIIFAIPDPSHRKPFDKVFGDILCHEPLERRSDSAIDASDDQHDAHIQKLMAQAAVLELRMDEARSSFAKQKIKDELRAKTHEIAVGKARNAFQDDDHTNEPEDVEDDFVVAGYPASDGEENTFYTFGDPTSDSGASDDGRSEIYQFRFGGPSDSTADEDEDYERMTYDGFALTPGLDPQTGWFKGSIEELHYALRTSGRVHDSISPRSPLDHELPPGTEPPSSALSDLLLRFGGSDIVDPSE
jgi:uncharacterized protein (TIGR02452 family)